MSHPWGLTRAHYYAQGLSLPPRGSAQDEVIAELHRRDMNRRFAEVRLFARLIGAGAGVPEDAIERELDLYLVELSQDRYRPAVVAALRAARTSKRQREHEDRRLLDRLDKLTVADEKPPKRRPRRK